VSTGGYELVCAMAECAPADPGMTAHTQHAGDAALRDTRGLRAPAATMPQGCQGRPGAAAGCARAEAPKQGAAPPPACLQAPCGAAPSAARTRPAGARSRCSAAARSGTPSRAAWRPPAPRTAWARPRCRAGAPPQPRAHRRSLPGRGALRVHALPTQGRAAGEVQAGLSSARAGLCAPKT